MQGRDDTTTPLIARELSPLTIEDREDSQREEGVAANLEAVIRQSVAIPKLPRPRVHLAAASWSFEEAALAILRKGSIGHKRSEEVCQLLLCGIQHDLLFKRRMKNARKKGRPSFRLYDLLAGISVRYRQQKYFVQLLELVDRSEQRLLFETRLEKWQDITCPWRQRWRNRREPVTWEGNSGAVIL
jgi:hypothetical protein